MGACGRGWRAAGYSYPTPALTRRFPSRSQAYVSLSVGGATAAGVGEGVAVAVGVGTPPGGAPRSGVTSSRAAWVAAPVVAPRRLSEDAVCDEDRISDARGTIPPGYGVMRGSRNADLSGHMHPAPAA
jgi:hypothetical protein